MKKIVLKLVSELKKRTSEEISLSELIDTVYGVNCLKDCEIEGVRINYNSLFDVLELVKKEAKKQSIYLDFSRYYGQYVGLPYNIPFVVKTKRPKSQKYITNFNEKLRDAKKFKLHIFDYFNPGFPTEITFEDNKVYRYSRPWSMNDDLDGEKQILDMIKEEFIYELVNINIAAWDREYVDPYVLDGTQWNFEIQYNDGKKKKYSGSNDFPNGFEELCELFGLDYFDEDEEYEEVN